MMPPSTNVNPNWIQTYTGKSFYLDETMKPEQFCVEDVAHALSMLCRFNGHVREFYSVAQHSVIVASVVVARCLKDKTELDITRMLALAALFHDATEAYIGDVVRPLKRMTVMEPYRQLEIALETVMAQAFDIEEWALMHPWIKAADNSVLATEVRDLLSTPDQKHELRVEPHPWVIVPSSQRYAEAKFLEAYRHCLSADFPSQLGQLGL